MMKQNFFYLQKNLIHYNELQQKSIQKYYYYLLDCNLHKILYYLVLSIFIYL